MRSARHQKNRGEIWAVVYENPLARRERFMQITTWVGGDSKGDQSMQKFISGLVVASAMALSAPVIAAPISGQAGLAAAVDSGVEQVADGCGRGWHRGPGGRCRPNRAVIVAPPVVVLPGAGWCHGPRSSRQFRC
jgi:hypothetical protein